MIHRRTLAARIIAALLLAWAPTARAQADDFPSRPIVLVAPFPAGSVTDAVTRVLANSLSQSFGKPAVVENKAGAQGTIGAAFVANAKPDGHTLLVGSSVMFVANSLYKTLPYDPVKSFTPVAGVVATAGAPQVPTLQEAFPRAAGALDTIIAIMAPAGTPEPIVRKLEAVFGQAMASTEVRARFQVPNTSVLSLSARQLEAGIREDNPRWESLMRKAGIEPQ